MGEFLGAFACSGSWRKFWFILVLFQAHTALTAPAPCRDRLYYESSVVLSISRAHLQLLSGDETHAHRAWVLSELIAWTQSTSARTLRDLATAARDSAAAAQELLLQHQLDNAELAQALLGKLSEFSDEALAQSTVQHLKELFLGRLNQDLLALWKSFKASHHPTKPRLRQPEVSTDHAAPPAPPADAETPVRDPKLQFSDDQKAAAREFLERHHGSKNLQYHEVFPLLARIFGPPISHSGSHVTYRCPLSSRHILVLAPHGKDLSRAEARKLLSLLEAML